jgi:hypothetical protein
MRSRRHARILSGPSFAADVARGLPTAVTLAAADKAATLAKAIGSATFRPYRSTDVRGVEHANRRAKIKRGNVTEFAIEVRHYCRNPKCRMRLPEPVSNKREAFCTRGCHQSFYRKRCVICEKSIERTVYNRKICKNAICRSAFKANSALGGYSGSQSVKPAREVPVNQVLFSASKRIDPLKSGWRQIAGPPLTVSQFHCAILPGTAMDDALCIEARNRAALQAAEQAAKQAEIEANGYFTEPEWHEYVSPDACEKYNGRSWVTRFRSAAKPTPSAVLPIPEDLSIPAFLERRTTAATLTRRNRNFRTSGSAITYLIGKIPARLEAIFDAHHFVEGPTCCP